jgi:hypothetical protein
MAERGIKSQIFEELSRLKLSITKGMKEFVKAEFLHMVSERRAFIWLHRYDLVEDFFAVPMMSAECERVFSAAKNLVTERQMGLKEDIIEAMCLLRHWYKEEGVI